jgi:hypothetical protein
MTTIFIPVLFICLNASCEFMQSRVYFKDREQCMENVDSQKQHMRDLIGRAGQDEIHTLEGSCVSFDVKIVRKETTSF